MLHYDMLTKYAKKMDKNTPLPEYPRTYLKRDSYHNLNGLWNYEVNDKKGTILVPYPIESYLSSVRMDLDKDDTLIYNKDFNIEDDLENKKVVLHFDGIMQESIIYINNNLVYNNHSGFVPISIDVTSYINTGLNHIKVEVKNTPNFNYGLGKEAKERGGMWYTKTTGIYKSVWYEILEDEIKDIKFKINLSGDVEGTIIGAATSYHIQVFDGDKLIIDKDVENAFKLKIESPKLWSVDEPFLYDVIINNKSDKVYTYFAFKEFKVKGNKFYLNNNEIFIHGLLDQGYFSDGIYTPASYEAFYDDIMRAKEMGFNALRKHIKFEHDYFYYLCDKLGMLVLQDFPNSGKYHFMIDTALPTVGIKCFTHSATKEREEAFIADNKNMIEILSHHPAVVYFTIFNEGWGEFKTPKMYRLFKKMYPEYVFDSASGWFNQRLSDVYSIHNYFYKLKAPKKNKPVIISEYGGYQLRIPNHYFNDDADYGYHKCTSLENLKTDLDNLFNAIKNLDNLAGAIYTQLTDVEDETNGLITYDREVVKYQK